MKVDFCHMLLGVSGEVEFAAEASELITAFFSSSAIGLRTRALVGR